MPTTSVHAHGACVTALRTKYVRTAGASGNAKRNNATHVAVALLHFAARMLVMAASVRPCSLLASLCIVAIPRGVASFSGPIAVRGGGRTFASASIMAKKAPKSSSNNANDDAASSGGGILMILSPAKTLDLSPFEPPSSDAFPALSMPDCDATKTKLVAEAMKARSKKELEKLLSISANLAATSHQYWSDFDPSGADEDSTKPAIYSFSGAAYKGLDIATMDSVEALQYMQNNLRIVDPLYGALRPLDMMQPYRLEMATKNALDKKTMDGAKDLANWWKESVTSSISQELETRKDKILLNVASDEYSAAVDATGLPEGTKFIKAVFQQEGRVIAVHAKRARGLMVRYLSENGVKDVDGILGFDAEGWRYVKSKSTDDSIVFDRPKPAAKPKKKAPAKSKAGGPKSKKAKTK